MGESTLTTSSSSKYNNRIVVVLEDGDEETKTAIRVKAAMLDMSTSKYVGRLIEEAINGSIKLPEES